MWMKQFPGVCNPQKEWINEDMCHLGNTLLPEG